MHLDMVEDAEKQRGMLRAIRKPHVWLGLTRSPHVHMEMLQRSLVRRIGSRASGGQGVYEIESLHIMDPQFAPNQ